ncbi:NAD-dependent SIR2 family protein deacetylase [Paraburkholderia sp. BL23I1N1]|uniref:SIR2 family NAD-dependent protein deacylase n=1 Tax=Paraburkholderia sp. BL23I1N1 TaxID=1938802 RepID=UPI000FF29548|nr:Sir2 family NAD-dependent protein deacetylase [Paraburkholderia sp. BL23I1N1]RKE34698.1 NAD-dependent SIR2 family protein deacetylase [Paraburkholderia sp. BL23I1N1]
MTDSQDEKLEKAAGWLREADGLLITAGAGMGVDSGLPDFRGRDGFWCAYPALRHQGLSFEDVANPAMFAEHPELAWGFYGHRLKLYRKTVPHEGFTILRRWADRMTRGAFVFTSNVDGQFQKAGFSGSRVRECHGSIHALQCLNACTNAIWSAEEFHPQVDEEMSILENPMPRCPRCGSLARPNILMFGDWGWVDAPYEKQMQRLDAWISTVAKLVVVELGAGKALPTVRRFSEKNARNRLIRINPREASTNTSHGVGLEGGAVAMLGLLDAQQ